MTTAATFPRKCATAAVLWYCVLALFVNQGVVVCDTGDQLQQSLPSSLLQQLPQQTQQPSTVIPQQFPGGQLNPYASNDGPLSSQQPANVVNTILPQPTSQQNFMNPPSAGYAPSNTPQQQYTPQQHSEPSNRPQQQYTSQQYSKPPNMMQQQYTPQQHGEPLNIPQQMPNALFNIPQKQQDATSSIPQQMHNVPPNILQQQHTPQQYSKPPNMMQQQYTPQQHGEPLNIPQQMPNALFNIPQQQYNQQQHGEPSNIPQQQHSAHLTPTGGKMPTSGLTSALPSMFDPSQYVRKATNAVTGVVGYGTGMKNAMGGKMMDTANRFLDGGRTIVHSLFNAAEAIPMALLDANQKGLQTFSNMILTDGNNGRPPSNGVYDYPPRYDNGNGNGNNGNNGAQKNQPARVVSSQYPGENRYAGGQYVVSSAGRETTSPLGGPNPFDPPQPIMRYAFTD